MHAHRHIVHRQVVESARSGGAASRIVSRARANDVRAAKACAICGCDRIEVDEVLHGGRVELSECARCHHRWTRALPSGVVRVSRALARPASTIGKEASAAA